MMIIMTVMIRRISSGYKIYQQTSKYMTIIISVSSYSMYNNNDCDYDDIDIVADRGNDFDDSSDSKT
jgi:hypothetical protein